VKLWMTNLLDQLGFLSEDTEKTDQPTLSEDHATLLYIIDVYNRHLFQIEGQPVRKVRGILDAFSKELVHSTKGRSHEEILFRFRQWFSSYRVDEYGYIQNTFEDFKGIIWDFADQLAEELRVEKDSDQILKSSLDDLREAVDSNSIDALRAKSREFINTYIESHSQKDERRQKKIKTIQRNLSTIKKQLSEAHKAVNLDHLTGAFNRRSFDEQMKRCKTIFEISESPVSMIVLDIDFFKRINDSYGHEIGDFVLKEFVHLLQELFARPEDMVCRIGGEEFVVLLPGYSLEHAVKRAEEALERIRKDVLVHGDLQIAFTASMGIAQLNPGETPEQWLKRADTALYASKHNGRNQVTIAKLTLVPDKIAG
jgi:diguanylate cyclase